MDKIVVSPKLSELEQLAASDPQEFVSQYAELKQSIANSSHSRDAKLLGRLSYLYAKSLFIIHKLGEAKKAALESIPVALNNKDYETLIRHYLLLAKCFYHTDEKHRIKACFEIALEYARQAIDSDLLGFVCLDYGEYHSNSQSWDLAMGCFETALKTIDKSQNSILKKDVLLGMGNVYYRRLNYKKALGCHTRAFELALTIGDKPSQIEILDQLATLYALTNKFETAAEMIDKALEACNYVPGLKFKILFNAGTLKLRQNSGSEALDLFQKAEIAAIQSGFQLPHFYCELNNNIAGCYWKMGDIEKTREFLAKATSIVENMRDPELLTQTKLNQTHCMILMGDYENARKVIDEAIEYYSRSGNMFQLLTANRALEILFEQSGDLKSALAVSREIEKNYQKQIDMLKQELSGESESKIAFLAKRYPDLEPEQETNAISFVGTSTISHKVLESAQIAAQHPNANVFIFGESGTGKDVLANIIHYNSIRRDSPFIVINMAALSPGLLESELFGHVRGAFTGATSNKKGLFLKANHGTLFLDEITEIPFDLQAKLLRVVETGKFTPVGSNEELSYDSRIICSSNRDIYQAIRLNNYRLDLFHRLNTIEIYIPPLRERKQDIEDLLAHYTMVYANQNKLHPPEISQRFIDKIRQYPFPGNVRELKNLVERLYILKGNESWTEEDLIDLNLIRKPAASEALSWSDPEIGKIILALEQCDGKQKDAARLLGMSESTLCRRVVKYNLEAYTLRHRH